LLIIKKAVVDNVRRANASANIEPAIPSGGVQTGLENISKKLNCLTPTLYLRNAVNPETKTQQDHVARKSFLVLAEGDQFKPPKIGMPTISGVK
jgi:hypothetical protein